jgi:predicted RNA-binding Zn ribbon-like protein
MDLPSRSRSAHDTVLDFLNTVVSEKGHTADLLQTDEQVATWLENAGFLGAIVDRRNAASLNSLAHEARSLRETVRELLMQWKAGRTVDTGRLNLVLANVSYRVELVEDEAGGLQVMRRYAADTPLQMLAPLAVAAADLLARGDLRLIRKCESESCPVWFRDSTRAHRRRWCNLARCSKGRTAAPARCSEA